MNPLIAVTAAVIIISLVLSPVNAGASDDWWKPFVLTTGICLGVGICIVLIAGGMDDLFGEGGLLEKEEDDTLSMVLAPQGEVAPFSIYSLSPVDLTKSADRHTGEGLNLVRCRRWHLELCAKGVEVRF